MLKATGIVRKVDELGRIVIPMELRKTMGIDLKDPLEIFVDGDKIILKKYEPGCVITGSQDNLISFQGKLYSREVIRQLAEQAALIK
ncbi:AbrB/MazE/SpoVT family DNA-binding domain-containing protein [Paenibacillus monticola]|uniref:AbrB/MazE/SpoVT family DNA-binding domain-containing protein n=1 Tax=Paenibacillus monticola TaxID=2666075 RepID=A0A7X2L5L2_9BACL|nr:AbrB/MazE/SpoVT family DNA-binding domain-containing protein [Paenibacillus monticola]MRN56796.1 AbrB/MazE/SpoVT family DNA-binding domain-containing protein [Paenibacillus monticola]